MRRALSAGREAVALPGAERSGDRSRPPDASLPPGNCSELDKLEGPLGGRVRPPPISARNFGGITVPHPFPYQGSKRSIARHILPHFPRSIGSLIEPFCGSAALSIAAVSHGLAERVWLNDVNAPLIRLWGEILENPERLAAGYGALWNEQRADRKQFFLRIRREFNETHETHHLLYLLARIVKGSIRYGRDGRFNQSPDNRRAGMRPATMRRQILGVSNRLSGRTRLTASDYRMVAAQAAAEDLVYLDPPYQGTSSSRDQRYYSGVGYGELVGTLQEMNAAGISFIVSYDGRTGNKDHGRSLPEELSLTRLPIRSGVSSQSVLLGNASETIESLYLSPALRSRLDSGEERGHRRRGAAHAHSLFA